MGLDHFFYKLHLNYKLHLFQCKFTFDHCELDLGGF